MAFAINSFPVPLPPSNKTRTSHLEDDSIVVNNSINALLLPINPCASYFFNRVSSGIFVVKYCWILLAFRIKGEMMVANFFRYSKSPFENSPPFNLLRSSRLPVIIPSAINGTHMTDFKGRPFRISLLKRESF